MMRAAPHIICLAGIIALSGCASPGEPGLQSVPVALAAPPSGQGQIVFYRPSGLGMLIGCTVRENGRMVAPVGDGRYFVVPAEPGPHTFTVKSEATDTLRIEVEPDETSYVRCNIGMGIFVGRPNLSPSNAQEFSRASSRLRPIDPKKIAEETAKDEANRSHSDAAERRDH